MQCDSWGALLEALDNVRTALDVQDGEALWFRGCRDCRHTLTPSLMRLTEGLTNRQHDGIEQSLFFEFQARAAELRARGLTDWEYLFFGRHYGVPTRVLDWTDTFGVATYFAVEAWARGLEERRKNHHRESQLRPAIWVLNPYALNDKTYGARDIILPKNLGPDREEGEDEYWDFGELLGAPVRWGWEGPVAIYPIQINERARAQRGWFTIHGNDRRPLELQAPANLIKLVLQPRCVDEALNFLELAGVHRFSIYPDLENLAGWIGQSNWAQADSLRARKTRPTRQPRRP